MTFQFPKHDKPKEVKNKCRIIVKRKADGTTIKEIQGECSSAQLRALSDQPYQEE